MLQFFYLSVSSRAQETGKTKSQNIFLPAPGIESALGLEVNNIQAPFFWTRQDKTEGRCRGQELQGLGNGDGLGRVRSSGQGGEERGGNGSAGPTQSLLPPPRSVTQNGKQGRDWNCTQACSGWRGNVRQHKGDTQTAMQEISLGSPFNAQVFFNLDPCCRLLRYGLGLVVPPLTEDGLRQLSTCRNFNRFCLLNAKPAVLALRGLRDWSLLGWQALTTQN